MLCQNLTPVGGYGRTEMADDDGDGDGDDDGDDVVVKRFQDGITFPDEVDATTLPDVINRFDNLMNSTSVDGTGSEIEEVECFPSKGCSGILSSRNTCAVGTTITVQLRKGSCGGLGFSITARDNQSGLDSPIFIKHILPGGVAMEDGRLRSGDRLLQVDEMSMTRKSLSEVTAILRGIETNALVCIVVSRQTSMRFDKKLDDLTDKCLTSKQQPSECLPSKGDDRMDSQGTANESRAKCSNIRTDSSYLMETLTLKVAQDNSNAYQLGLRVKRSKRKDLIGIHVRSIISGGMADKDGQIQKDDHLIEVDGVSVVNINKSTVVNIFRSALMKALENQCLIKIIILRQRLLETASSLPFTSNIEIQSEQHFSRPSHCLSVGMEGDEFFGVLNSAAENFSLEVSQHYSENDLALTSVNEAFSSTRKHSSDFIQSEDSFLLCRSIHELEQTCVDGSKNICVDNFTSRVAVGQDESSTSRGIADGMSDDVQFSEAESSDLQDEDPSSDPGALVFRRDGFGRKSISEKRNCRDFLSGSEIYRNIKECRKKKEQQASELKSLDPKKIDANGNVEESQEEVMIPASVSPGVEVDEGSFKPPCQKPMTEVQVDPMPSLSAKVCDVETVSGTNSPSNISLSPGQTKSSTLPSSSRSTKPLKKFDASVIRGFFKKGYTELFRSETQKEILQHGCDGQNFSDSKNEGTVAIQTPQIMYNNDCRRGTSLPRFASYHGPKDISASMRFPEGQPRLHPSTLFTNTASFYPGRLTYHPTGFHVPPNAVTAFPMPVQCFHLNPLPATPGFLTQYRFPVPPMQLPTGFALNPSLFQQPTAHNNIMYSLHGNASAVRLIRPVLSQSPWTRCRQKVRSIVQLTRPEPTRQRQYSKTEQE